MDDIQISPHPDVESLSNSELRDALAKADEDLDLLHKLPTKDRDLFFETWLVQERRLILAELNRRNVQTNFASDYRDPSSEVKFEREVNLGVLQARAIEQGDMAVTFLPLLGQDRFIVKGWSHLVAAYPKTG